MANRSTGNEVGLYGRNSNRSPALPQRPPRSLAHAVELAVGQIDEALLTPVADQRSSETFQAGKVLALLTYCYARQIYSSTVIAAQLRRDFNAFKLADDGLPDGRMLRRFRCENRGPLDHCLRAALIFLAEQKIKQGFVTHVREAHIVQEASRRVIMAMFTDSLEMEPEPEHAARFQLSFSVARSRGRIY
jgi:hypothetical protein